MTVHYNDFAEPMHPEPRDSAEWDEGTGRSAHALDLLTNLHPDWQKNGACRDKDPALWFPEPHGEPPWDTTAVDICNGCPVKEQCLDFAIVNRIPDGIWGGMRRDARKKLRTRLRAGAA